jgi:hypothetical protein
MLREATSSAGAGNCKLKSNNWASSRFARVELYMSRGRDHDLALRKAVRSADIDEFAAVEGGNACGLNDSQ